MLVLGDKEQLKNWLVGSQEITQLSDEDVTIGQDGVRVRMHNEPETQAELLKQLIGAGFTVLEYTAESRSLEDLFLQITTGAVQ